jgi:hypothetical protein
LFDRDFERQAETYLAQASDDLRRKYSGKSLAQQKFDTANGFFLAARRCAVHEDAGEGQTNSPTSPMICCLAFACELYLKSMLDKPMKGHSLLRLFDKLSLEDKESVSEKFDILTGRNSDELKSDIQDFSDAFIEWRYIFEQGSSRLWVSRLWMFASALYQHVREMNADWVVDDFTDRNLIAPIPQQAAVTVALGGGLMIQLRQAN